MSHTPDIDRGHLFSGILRIYLYYRVALGLLLLGAFLFDIGNNVFGHWAPDVYLSTVIIYVVLAALGLGFYQLQRHQLRSRQLFVYLLSDVAVQTVLMACSGGLDSGLGYLMLITVTLGAIFFSGQLAILIPAVASICIIVESLVSAYLFDQQAARIFPAGVLGVLLFTTSLVFLRLSDALVAAQRSLQTETDFSAGLQELNRLIIDRMRTGVIVVDGAAVIQQINQAARELLGRDGADTPLRIGDSIRAETKLLERLTRWQRVPESKFPPFIPHFGATELQVNFANLEAGAPDNTIIFLEDFRSQAQHAQQLKLASLGRLTGSIAHEIRNPLGAISHASQLLGEQETGSDTAARLTTIINTQVKRVNHIVESVMQLSRRRDHNPQRVDLIPWLEQFVHDYRLGNRNHSTVDLTVKDDVIAPITFDPVHLEQVLTNLLDNAVRYSREQTGTPWAQIVVAAHTTTGTVSLDVHDRGPGVPATHRAHLFEPFFSTSSGGSGLGLYIARELCTINYAGLKYQEGDRDEDGFFRLTFVHPAKILNLPEEAHASR